MHAAMPEMGGKLALYGALQLYLDFINLFQFILLLSGGRKRRLPPPGRKSACQSSRLDTRSVFFSHPDRPECGIIFPHMEL